MKINFLLLLIFLSTTIKIFAQNENEGYIVEDNKNILVKLSNYQIPVKINRVNSQDQIDYSTIDGLLQSFFSATNEKWALDEYLNKNLKISRDAEHFEATKKLNQNNYIQKEIVYEFNYLNHKMAYVKYSFIAEKVPFPIIGVMSMENINNRWYISNLLNQGAILSIISRTDPTFLIDLFSGKSINKEYNELIKKSKNKSGIVDILILYKNIQQLHDNNSSLYKQITDQRLIIENLEFRNAAINSKPILYNFTISQPFLYDNVQLNEYRDSEKGITKLDKRSEKFSNLPESLIIDDIPINLIAKLKITFQNEDFFIIKYEKNNKKYVTIIQNENGNFLKLESDNFKNITELLVKTKASFLHKILSNTYPQSKDYISGSDGGMNVSLALEYISLNKSTLSKYLDN
ncbi:MAG: hypothetical protein REI96_11620 [Flavobacterium nitrogenifigens]|uniref:hypothetical protein n=1 Tax=Flavobacterium nitrogenifigens TaxID=1617283 RepID=UPI00280A0856|nr:hypothetical protein [Flavobacterium nitrogenifigens]MDQ8013090.1 hypothetical protein [Flavobacterium nitrogenifigens]